MEIFVHLDGESSQLPLSDLNKRVDSFFRILPEIGKIHSISEISFPSYVPRLENFVLAVFLHPKLLFVHFLRLFFLSFSCMSLTSLFEYERLLLELNNLDFCSKAG